MTTKPAMEPQDFVESILTDAITRKASDIYLIPCASTLNIRYRTDGILENIETLPSDYGDKCIARIKVLAGLLTYKTKVAQDGAIRTTKNNTEMRVAVMPTHTGERISIRIMENRNAPLYLEDLDFPSPAVSALQLMLERPTGMIVLTGPTGSGKTTTIYAMIRELLKKQQDPASIITIEDPVECEIEGISQTAISVSNNWNYAGALRAALRQDVKTLIVGEMRDKDVVQVTLDAALTGHRIIATYHAGDIPSVYARMLHQGFEPFVIASAITGVLNQRLVSSADNESRIPIASALIPDDKWRELVISNPGLSELRRKIADYPDADLLQTGQRMLKKGLISEQTLQQLKSDPSANRKNNSSD